jgi:glucosyl-3-phosphoglycerate synthase
MASNLGTLSPTPPARRFPLPSAPGSDPAIAARDLAALKRETGQSITVVVPAGHHDAAGVVRVCEALAAELMGSTSLVDALLLLDTGTTEGVRGAARRAGAEVVDIHDVLPEVPVCPGRGESLWRSLAVVDTQLVVWVDPDLEGFTSQVVAALVSPLLVRPDVDFVKARYHRPLQPSGVLLPESGDRVTELVARPLLSHFFPALTSFAQPLSTEYAGRTAILRSIPFFTGDSVDVGLIIDLLAAVGLDRMVQADLEARARRHRSLAELAPRAHHIVSTILRRAHDYGELSFTSPTPTRGPQSLMPQRERPAMDLVSRSTHTP